MSCFGMAITSTSSSRRGRPKPWRWWRKCTRLAAAVHSKLRRSVRWSAPGIGFDGRRRRAPSSSLQRGWCHHRSFAPVYVDELYSQPKSLSPRAQELHAQEEEEPSTSGSKLAARVDADATAAGTSRVSARASGKARVGANTSTTSSGGARAGGKARADAAPAKSVGVRSVVMSPSRGGGGGGGGVLRVVNGMGEVDLRAELFIRKFREEMRLQSQKSAEEFQAMLARGL